MGDATLNRCRSAVCEPARADRCDAGHETDATVSHLGVTTPNRS